jgi:glycerol-3-phosphate acyltransferase PlsY
MTIFIVLAIASYLLGSIPFGYIIPKLHGVDIRTIGSKATSTTNVSRALGWRWALLSGLLDVVKGFVPAYLAVSLLSNEWQIITVCLLPVVGHVFPVWLKFKGGKGAAPYFGATLVLVGLKFFLLSFLIWILAVLITKIMSLSNIIYPWALAALIYFYFPFYYFIYAVIGAVLITIALRENIVRLIKGVEPKMPFKW